ncbi:polymorphic toxin type 4 domain-containing protein [Sphingomonas psychrotolerans]|uniref:Bacterial toxin 4 domain-containing protein n=1 Tax=Sphingomonas psychrotolerans TaxID=1327635 RepID=A0A2K8MAL1_9SPHN|nr:polymorphic toxin type 4 domain-containing protein [Sphingomonas psychrotolerans]ATY30903.1 hypothetical protein CVN68_01980 [Sphingomonas psychrotolerans]
MTRFAQAQRQDLATPAPVPAAVPRRDRDADDAGAYAAADRSEDALTEIAEILQRMLYGAGGTTFDDAYPGSGGPAPDQVAADGTDPGTAPAEPGSEQAPQPADATKTVPPANSDAARLADPNAPAPAAPKVEPVPIAKGDAVVPGSALPPVAPLAEPVKPPAPPIPAPPVADVGASPKAIVQRWQGGVAAAGGSLPKPKVAVPDDAKAAATTGTDAATKRNTAARDGLTDEAKANLPTEDPKVEDPPPPPPNNPIPEQTAKIIELSGLRLDPQDLPGLVRSEHVSIPGESATPGTEFTVGGELPRMTEKPVAADLFQILTTPGAAEIAKLDPGATGEDGKLTSEAQRMTDALTQLASTETKEEKAGKGEPVHFIDKGPKPMKPLPPGLAAPVGKVVARLLAEADETAAKVLDSLREQAFGGGVLKKEFPQIGATMAGELKPAVDTELRDIATAAGVSADALAGMVTERQAELEASAAKAAEEAKTTGDKAAETVAGEGQKTMDAVAGAADAAEEEMLRRQEAAGGAADPTVINARRDRSIGWIKEHVTTQTTNYQKAGENRERELNDAKRQQTDAYKALVQREQFQVLAPQPTRAPRDLTDKPREARLADATVTIRTWGDTQITALAEAIRLLVAAAGKQTSKNRKAIEGAGTTAIEAANVWAEDKVLAGQGWWTRFVARIKRWIGEAKSLNTEWKVRRTEENRDAVAQDLVFIGKIQEQLANGTTKDELLKSEQLSAAQKAVITQFFDVGGDKDPLNFAVVRLRATIASSHLPAARKAFEAELTAMPVSYGQFDLVEQLERVANGDGGGFSAATIAIECHAAMDQIGTDEDKIFGALRGLTGLRGAIVRKAYRAKFDSDLDADLEDELSGDEHERAKAELAGETNRADAVALHDAIAGIGTNEKAIMETLRNKTPAELEAIRAEYLAAYGETLDAALKGDLDEGNEIDQADALLSGDTDKADAIQLDDAMRGGFLGLGTSEEDIEKVYTRVREEVQTRARAEHWTSAQMEAEVRRRLGKISSNFEDRYKNVDQYKEGTGGTALERAFSTELEGPELDLANALQKNDMVAADAARIEVERQGFYASDEKLVKVMRSQYDRALDARRLDEGPARDMVIAREMEGWRAQRPQLSEDELSRKRIALERKMNAEIEAGAKVDAKASTEALTKVYEKKYRPSLAYELSFNMSGSDHDAAQALLKNGGWLSPIEEVEFATKGDGTDEDQLKKTFSTLTKAEIDAMRIVWNKKHPDEDFDEMLRGELSGRDEVDVMDMVEHGAPESAKEQLAQEDRRVNHELDELTGVLGGAAAGKEADWMRYQQKKLAELGPKLDRTDWPETEAGQREREALAGEVQMRVDRTREAVEDHRRRIDSVTDSVTMVVGVVIAVVAGVFSGGTLTALIITSLISTAASMVTKALIKGGAYGGEEIGVDLAIGAVDLLTLKLGDKLVKPIKALMNKIPFGKVASAVGKSGVAQKALRLPGAAKLGSLAGKAVPKLARGVERFAGDSLDSAAGALSTTAAGLALNDATWKGDPLANFLEGGGMSILQAVAMGHLLKPVIGGLRGHVDTMRTEARMRTDVGRQAEAHAVLSAAYERFRQENPFASTSEFLMHPEGRRVSAEIAERGLLPTIESVNKRIAADAELRAAAVKADADAATGTPLSPAEAKAKARAETLTAALPAKQREGTTIVADTKIEGRGVHVTPVTVDGRIVGVEVRVGPDATPLDVALHAGTVHAVQKYTGTMGRLRTVIENAGAMVSRSGLKVGSKGWEARLELAKLPGIMAAKFEGVGAHPLTPDVEARLLADLAGLDAQIERHRAVLDDPAQRREQGRGYIAAEDADAVLREAAKVETDIKRLGKRMNNQGDITERGVLDLETKLKAARKLIKQSRKQYLSDGERAALLDKVGKMLAEAEETFHLAPGTLADHLTIRPSPEVKELLARPVESSGAPTPSPPAKPPGPNPDGDALRDRLKAPDERGPRKLIEKIANASNDPKAAADAQKALNKMSSAPADATVVNITQAEIDRAYYAKLEGPPHGSKRYTVTVNGLEMTVYRSADPKDKSKPTPPVKFEAVIPRRDGPPVVYQFGNGELRVWLVKSDSTSAPDVLRQETLIGPRKDRAGFEDQQYSHREGKLFGSKTERAHAHGAGLGVESPFGIGPNPRDVNQILQNKGIEHYMRELRDLLAESKGIELLYETSVEFAPLSMRQSRIVYRIDMVIEGKRIPFAEFDIDIETGVVQAPRAKDKAGDTTGQTKPDGDPPAAGKKAAETADPKTGKKPDEIPEGPRKLATKGIETEGIAQRRQGHEFEALFDLIYNHLDRPEVIELGLPRQSGKSKLIERIDALNSPAEVTAAFAGDPGVSFHPPAKTDSFDATTWALGLQARLDGTLPTHFIIVDLDPALNLTKDQRKALTREVKKLPWEVQRRVIVIRRAQQKPPKVKKAKKP